MAQTSAYVEVPFPCAIVIVSYNKNIQETLLEQNGGYYENWFTEISTKILETN